jgi:uncharacterized membrane protein
VSIAVGAVVSGAWTTAGGLTLYLLLLPPVIAAIRERRDSNEASFTGVLLLGGWSFAAASELVVIGDRMNTVFKLYQPAWAMTAVASAAAVAAIVERRGLLVRRGTVDGGTVHVWRPLTSCVAIIVAAALSIGAACTWRAIDGVLTRNLKPSDKPTLDGVDFLRHTPEERELLEAVTWLNRNTRGLAVVAEAYTGISYDQSARVAKYTGLPVLLGWSYHLEQRGQRPEQIRERANDLRRLYTSEQAAEILGLCRRYGVRFIFVGDLERGQYGDAVPRLGKVAGLREVFRSATGANVIFEVAPPGPPQPGGSAPS